MLHGKKVIVIVAYVFSDTGKYAIGNDNKLIVDCREDMRHFRKRTTFSNSNKKNAVVMGNTTFESIGKTLPNRINIVFSKRNEHQTDSDCFVVNDMKNFIDTVEQIGESIDIIYIIGGESIYAQFFETNIVDEIIATEFYTPDEFQADRFFHSKWFVDFFLTEEYTLTKNAVVKIYKN